MWHPLRTVSFFGKMSRLALYLKIKLYYHLIIHVFGEVRGPTSIRNLLDEYFKKTFLNVLIHLKITNSMWFT